MLRRSVDSSEDSGGDESQPFPIGIIIGVVVGAVVCLLLLFIFWKRRRSLKQHRTRQYSSGSNKMVEMLHDPEHRPSLKPDEGSKSAGRDISVARGFSRDTGFARESIFNSSSYPASGAFGDNDGYEDGGYEGSKSMSDSVNFDDR